MDAAKFIFSGDPNTRDTIVNIIKRQAGFERARKTIYTTQRDIAACEHRANALEDVARFLHEANVIPSPASKEISNADDTQS